MHRQVRIGGLIFVRKTRIKKLKESFKNVINNKLIGAFHPPLYNGQLIVRVARALWVSAGRSCPARAPAWAGEATAVRPTLLCREPASIYILMCFSQNK